MRMPTWLKRFLIWMVSTEVERMIGGKVEELVSSLTTDLRAYRDLLVAVYFKLTAKRSARQITESQYMTVQELWRSDTYLQHFDFPISGDGEVEGFAIKEDAPTVEAHPYMWIRIFMVSGVIR